MLVGSGAGASGRRRQVLLLLLVLAAVFLAYNATLGFQFVLDDEPQAVTNPLIREARFIPHYFTINAWYQMVPDELANYYRPLFLLWLFLNYQLFGGNAAGWHLTTVLVHLTATTMVYALAMKILRRRGAALAAAVVFGFHPVHIQAVAWVAGVTESLVATAILGTLVCYINARERKSGPWLAGALALYAVALLCKETGLAALLLVAAYEWIGPPEEPEAAARPWARRLGSALWACVPFFLLTALYMVARVRVLHGFSHPVVNLPLSVMALTMPSVLWFYLKVLLWPVGLSMYYDLGYVTGFSVTRFLLPLLAVAAAGVGLWLWWRKSGSRAVAFSAVMLAVALLPVLNLRIFPPDEFVGDRFAYLASAALALLAAAAIEAIPAGRATLFGAPAARTAAVMILAAVMMAAIASQDIYWADNLLLYYRGVSVAPGNNLARMNLANEVLARGLSDQAILLYQQALRRNPRDWQCAYNLGYAYYRLGKYAEAEQQMQRAAALNPGDADVAYYLGLSRMKQGKWNEATEPLRAAIQRDPRARGYRYSLGLVLEHQGKLPEALAMFKEELAKRPGAEPPRAHIVALEQRMEKN